MAKKAPVSLRSPRASLAASWSASFTASSSSFVRARASAHAHGSRVGGASSLGTHEARGFVGPVFVGVPGDADVLARRQLVGVEVVIWDVRYSSWIVFGTVTQQESPRVSWIAVDVQ